MNCKIIYSSIRFTLIAVLFLQCKSNNFKKFEFKSAGWKVSVPAYMDIQDSATIYKAFPHTGNLPQKMLLEVVDTGGWRLNGNTLTAGIQPMEKEKDWDSVLQFIRLQYAGTYDRDYLPKTKMDSAFSKETIDGKIFDKSIFKFTGPNSTRYTIIYSRPINGYEFHCTLSFRDTIKGRKLLEIINSSRFE